MPAKKKAPKKKVPKKPNYTVSVIVKTDKKNPKNDWIFYL